MDGKIVEKNLFSRKINIYLPPGYYETNEVYPIIYINDGEKFKEIFLSLVNDIEKKFYNNTLKKHVIVGIEPEDRLIEYTPWYSKALNKKFHDFGGKADEYLNFLEYNIQTYIEDNYRVSNDKFKRKILGYSLGALLSLYSVFKNNNYGKIASLCASNWYENWINFIKNEEIVNNDVKLLLISGEKEGINKTTVHKDSPIFAKEAYEIFIRRIGEGNVKMIWDKYSHHENVLNRYVLGLEYLME